MTSPDDEFHDLVESYRDGLIGAEGLDRLEARLLADESARLAFADAYRFQTELVFAVRARRAAARVLGLTAAQRPSADRRRRRFRRLAGAIAAGVTIAAVAFSLGRSARNGSAPPANVAWLVNAQDCTWDGPSGGNLAAGRGLKLRHGLAEIEFAGGARVLLQGPAELELISPGEARLHAGSLTARVPPGARGFTVHTPGGKVIDLGTEFGLAVDDAGGSALRVFDGEVEAVAGEGRREAAPVRLVQDQAARIDGRAVDLVGGPDGSRFVREIAPRRVVASRSVTLPFDRPAAGTLLDAQGFGTGLTHRLPGTGKGLPDRDPNLRLDPATGALELTTTSSDLNRRFRLDDGEYLGFRLADLGFGGTEDFEIVATLPDIPGLEVVGQFGLYVGSRSDKVLRGGLIRQEEPQQYGLFLVNNDGGIDTDLEVLGLTKIGDDLRLVLRRVGGAYSLVVENLTRHSANTLAIAHPTYLDGERDLYVGLFGASPKTRPRILQVRQVGVTVRDTGGDPAR